MSRAVAGLALALALAWAPPARALSVEVLAGTSRSSIDTMFFELLPRRAGAEPSHTELLLFQRVRGSVGYRPADPADAPAFGITTALSWNPPALRGLAPVVVAQLLDGGPFVKVGAQYARVRERLTVFSWVVCALSAAPALDGFLMVRLTHPLDDRHALSGMVEGLATVPFDRTTPVVLVERARLGVRRDGWQVGPGLDLLQVPGAVASYNLGGFVRHDF